MDGEGRFKIKDLLVEAGAPREVYEEYSRSGRIDEEVKLPDKEEVERVANIISCLSNPKRLMIIALLSKPHCTCVLSKLIGEDQSLVSHHVAKLKSCGLISEKRIGRSRMYVRIDEALKKVLKELEELVSFRD